jgi:hypothetical protein
MGLTVLIAAGRNLMAQPNQPGQAQLTITEVTVGAPTPDLLRIVGSNLNNGPDLNVTLGEFPGSLSILGATATQIFAALPAPLPAGDYLLTVSTGTGLNRRDVYDLTVGAAGPQGPPGPPGAVPEGSIILWDQSNECPDGFARVSTYDGRFLVAGSSPGQSGGSNSHSHDAGTYTGPAHRHDLEPWDHAHPPVDDNSGGTDFNATTGLGGGGTMTGTSGLADSRPEFTTILLCRRIAAP